MIGIYRKFEIECEESVDEVTFKDITSDGKPIVLQPSDQIIVRFPDGKIVRVEFLTADDVPHELAKRANRTGVKA